MDARIVLLGAAAVALQWAAFGAAAESGGASTGDVFLFSCFKGNGEDGLHLAWSADGLKWTPLKNDTSFLKPTVGNDKLMRDPCIIRGPDGLFHMVWTVSWKERGIGYAHSKDLIRWLRPPSPAVSVAGNRPGIVVAQKTMYCLFAWS